MIDSLNSRVLIARTANEQRTPHPVASLAARLTYKLQDDGLVWILRCPHCLCHIEQRIRKKRLGSVVFDESNVLHINHTDWTVELLNLCLYLPDQETTLAGMMI